MEKITLISRIWTSIKSCLSKKNSQQLIIQIIILIIGTYLAFFKSYFSEKGKQVAMKEDIQALTKAVEDIKINYQRNIESYKDSLRKTYQIFEIETDTRKNVYKLLGETKILLRKAFRDTNNPNLSKAEKDKTSNDFLNKLIETGDYINANKVQLTNIKDQLLTFEKCVNDFMNAAKNRTIISPDKANDNPATNLANSIDDLLDAIYKK